MSVGKHKYCGGTIALIPDNPKDDGIISIDVWRCDKCKYMWMSELAAAEACVEIPSLYYEVDKVTGNRYIVCRMPNDATGLEKVKF